jgi:putative endonuclease
MKRQDTGNLGEKLAAGLIKEHGYDILQTNYRCPEGEVDIVARHKDCLVFVEVRTKRSSEFGSPEESITPAKMDKLRRVVAHYRQTHGDIPDSWRIDMVAVELDRQNRPQRIELIENAVGET